MSTQRTEEFFQKKWCSASYDFCVEISHSLVAREFFVGQISFFDCLFFFRADLRTSFSLNSNLSGSTPGSKKIKSRILYFSMWLEKE